MIEGTFGSYVHRGKKNGDIKARKCAAGSKQRTYTGYVYLEWASPTVSTDGVIIPLVIEAHQ